VPIIDLQRRMVEAGRIRAGEKGDKGEPRKLDKWRLTSRDKVRLDEAATLWGGEVRQWTERKGEFELYTETAALPIMLLPGQLPTTWYELWSKGGCQRRCDGTHEVISDASCLCIDERECKPHTRLSVLLPDLPGIGSWLLSSTGWNAAAELAGAADLLQRASAQGVLIPARLRLEARVQVQNGQTRRFSVPVIDIDVSFRELLGSQRTPGGELTPRDQTALPAGYVPVPTSIDPGVSLAAGLTAAESQRPQRTARSAAPIPAQEDLDFGGAPVPPDESGVPLPPQQAGPQPAPQSAPQTPSSDEKPLTLAQAKKKMNALVGQLREAGQITTGNLYAALARSRNIEVENMIALLEGAEDEEGELHWGPLRDTLTLEEARQLHARLARLWVKVQDEASLPRAAA
jgi:hypothetical protein